MSQSNATTKEEFAKWVREQAEAAYDPSAKDNESADELYRFCAAYLMAEDQGDLNNRDIAEMYLNGTAPNYSTVEAASEFFMGMFESAQVDDGPRSLVLDEEQLASQEERIMDFLMG